MANEARDIFFSEKNLDFTYGVVVQNVQKKTGADIQRHQSFKTVFNKMATSVYEKTPGDSRNLITLNSNLIEKSTTYIHQYIQKQRAASSNKMLEASPPTDYQIRPENDNQGIPPRGIVPISTQTPFNPQVGFSTAVPKPDLASEMAKMSSYTKGIQQPNYMPPVQYPAGGSPSVPSGYLKSSGGRQPPRDNSDVKGRYTSYLNARDSDLTSNTGQQGLSWTPADTDKKIGEDPMATLRRTAQQPGYQLQPFNISNEFVANLEAAADTPLYNNLQTLEKLDGTDTMKALEQYQRERSIQFQEFQKLQKEQQKIADATSQPYQQAMDDLDTLNSGLFTTNGERNRAASVIGDPKRLASFDQILTNGIVKASTDRQLFDNNGDLDGDHSINQKMKDAQREYQPKLVDRDHYVSINSIDRHWQSGTSAETRYSYKVNFDPAPGQQNIGVNRNFRNVVAVELVNVIVPHDNVIVPFDNRIYIDNSAFPYLLLQIDELDGVYRGTNSNSDRSFAHLLFDKEHNSDVLSTTYISSDTTPSGMMFSKQFARGFIRYTPGYFEKKTFFNNPIASLNRMTIRIVDPYGNAIDVQPDTLPISTIAYDNLVDHAIKTTTGFPNDNTGTTRQYLKITTGHYFCNRIFRIGDRIHISGIVSTVPAFQSFINRSQGHYIINLDTEVDTAGNYNKGFVNAIYISCPGEISANGDTIDSTTDIQILGTGTLTYTGAYLINENLQTHILLKITTRETDTYQTLNSINV